MPTEEDEPGLSPDPWSRVDPKIWAAGRPTGRWKRILQQLTSTFGISSIWALVIIGPLMILLTFAGTYYLVGASFFGPTLILVWSTLIAGFILVMEKTGYARNFEASDFKLSKERLLASVLSFAILVAVFYIVTVVLKRP
jgi:hypothetical protein